MALETFNYIDSLVVTNPTATDNVSQGDDHLRGIKTTLKNTFPNVTGAINATQAEVDILDGATVTTAEVNSLDMSGSASTAGDVLTSNGTGSAPTWQAIVSFDSGTKMVFAQASAPTGWTQDTVNNDKALRVVSGVGGGTGGTHALSSPPSTAHTHSTPAHSHTHTLSAGAHTLSTTQMPAHSHTYYAWGSDQYNNGYRVEYGDSRDSLQYNFTSASTGGGSSHSHTLSGSIDSGGSGTSGSAGPTAFAPQYVDVIVCSKD